MLKNFYCRLYKKIIHQSAEKKLLITCWSDTIRDKVLSLCKNKQGRLLEIGCGQGWFITDAKINNQKFELFGIDKDDYKLKKAQEKCRALGLKNISLIYADALNPPFKESYFDIIVCINTFVNLESIDIVDKMLQKMQRLCKKGGRIYFEFRNSLNLMLWFKYKLAPFYDITIKKDRLPLNTYRIKEIDKILDKLNFKINKKIYLGLPPKLFAPVIIIEAEKC